MCYDRFQKVSFHTWTTPTIDTIFIYVLPHNITLYNRHLMSYLHTNLALNTLTNPSQQS